jgi:hypothetical protein
MGYRCGVPNRTRPWNCRRQVKYSPCWQHRGSGGFSSSSLSSSSASQGWSGSEAAATALADALTDGISGAIAGRVANRVADYLGRLGAWRLRRQRRWAAVDCQALGDSARAVLALKQKAHELTGQAVSALLPEGTPRFHRILVRKIAEKLPLPWDVKLEAIARGLQVIGIWMCLVQNLPLEHCPCLQMYGVARFKERIEQEIEDLLEETRRDLQGQTHR